MNDDKARDTIFIGKKPLMTYVTSTLVQLANNPSVKIKARGISTGRAVDVAQIISRKTENTGYSIGNISIGSETMESNDGKIRNVSTIEIQVNRMGESISIPQSVDIEHLMDVSKPQKEILKIPIDELINPPKTLTKEFSTTVQNNFGDIIYEFYYDELKKEHYNEVVAIDIKNKKIVGFGNSVEEALKDARKKVPKDQLYFRRVGKSYVERI